MVQLVQEIRRGSTAGRVGAQSAADQAMAGLEAWELALARTTARALGVLTPRERQVLRERYGYDLDGDKEIRVLAEFPPSRGYGEA